MYQVLVVHLFEKMYFCNVYYEEQLGFCKLLKAKKTTEKHNKSQQLQNLHTLLPL